MTQVSAPYVVKHLDERIEDFIASLAGLDDEQRAQAIEDFVTVEANTEADRHAYMVVEPEAPIAAIRKAGLAIACARALLGAQ